MAPAVEIQQVDFAYTSQPVLRNINLSIARGTILGLIGPNGGGKTTLVRLLLGLIQPTRGTLRIDGLAPTAAVRRGDVIGYVPQHTPRAGSLPLSVRQVVRLGLVGKTGMLRPYAAADLQFADALLEKVGIAELADQSLASLSGGQLQRVYIARALAPRPMLLVLDEPTTGIDPGGQQRFIESLQGLQAQLGLTVVFVSHDLRAVCAIADRIACLNVRLHCHDVPDHLPPEAVYHKFACDLEAAGATAILDAEAASHTSK